MVLYAVDDEPDSFIDVVLVYNDQDLRKNSNFLFDFQVVYTRAPEIDSDGEEDLDYDNLETRTVYHIHEFDRDWLIGGDVDQIQATVYYILDMIDVPSYREIVKTLTKTILDLKKRDAISALPKVEKIEVTMEIIVQRLPGDAASVDVRLAVDPASNEAVERHLETVVVENDEGYCVICMDKIRVDSDVVASRMPCLHVFHRTCGEEWLRNSGICPVCRAVFPS